ncbi:MAG: HRDC domain-containing protein [Anaerolineae bacterium]|nr:HRDC domain-containing protein [Anaerolineae bacterium]
MTALLKALYDEPFVAVDTESNSLYVYQEQVCLIQVSVPNRDYIVDSLAILDLSPLAHFFADPKVQKIFHAAEYDVMCLKRDFGFRFVNLFDTMWAARILSWPRVGLGDILKDLFDVRTNKRYQRYDWGKRPLDQKALIYASLDTHYLLPLRHLQADGLMQKERWEEAQEVFEQVADSEPVSNDFETEDFWHVKGAFDLHRRELAVLRELCIWRDGEARRKDRPHFMVLHDRVLITLAQVCPRTREKLARIDGIKPYNVRRYGKRILQAIERGMDAPVPSPLPPPPRHSDEEVERYEALRTWRKEVAAEREVDVDVVVGNAVLWTLAEQNPRTTKELLGIEGLGPWKRRTYGEAILGVLGN